jgi:hypothetical protein
MGRSCCYKSKGVVKLYDENPTSDSYPANFYCEHKISITYKKAFRQKPCIPNKTLVIQTVTIAIQMRALGSGQRDSEEE